MTGKTAVGDVPGLSRKEAADGSRESGVAASREGCACIWQRAELRGEPCSRGLRHQRRLAGSHVLSETKIARARAASLPHPVAGQMKAR